MKIEKHPKEPSQYSMRVIEQFRQACREPGKWWPFDGVQAPTAKLEGRIRVLRERVGPGLEYARKFKRGVEAHPRLSQNLFPGFVEGILMQFRQNPEGRLAEESSRVAVEVCVGGARMGAMQALDAIIPDEAVAKPKQVHERVREITLPGGYTFVMHGEPEPGRKP